MLNIRPGYFLLWNPAFSCPKYSHGYLQVPLMFTGLSNNFDSQSLRIRDAGLSEK